MKEFPHDSIKPFSAENSKKEQVSTMFNSIAKRYDLVNRVLSAGIDPVWRKKAINCFKSDRLHLLLDVATGTGDMAIRAAKMLQVHKIIGIDISDAMLEVGREKVEKEHFGSKIELVSGDSETINFPDNSFDGVMVAFGVRNFERLEKGLGEILRVMKPGARLVVLEFSQPVVPGVKQLYGWYMDSLAPMVASWFKQNKKAYQYLNKSAKAFPDREAFVTILKNVGYSDTSFKPLSLGICCIYEGRKR
jgi:demethylmenaquinone methyltransferase/2-methoxy-6-polyprenyl-1,4-benzoquinol methylase